MSAEVAGLYTNLDTNSPGVVNMFSAWLPERGLPQHTKSETRFVKMFTINDEWLELCINLGLVKNSRGLLIKIFPKEHY